MSDDDFEPAGEPAPRKPPPAQRAAQQPTQRTLPRDVQSPEQYLIGCCLVDEGATLDKCIEAGLTATDLLIPSLGTILTHLRKMRAAGTPIALDTLVESLGPRIQEAGGITTLMALDQVGTTARASHALRTVLNDSERRRMERIARQMQEMAARGAEPEEIAELAGQLKSRPANARKTAHRSPFSFAIPPKQDPSILLGNRYLNRGDGIVISSSSGIGKSSMSHQMASDWGLGRPFHGIAPNGELRSLIVQSEDSDGDIGEVWASLQHVNAYTAEQRAKLNANVRIISEKTLRGAAFIRWLGEQIRLFSPDLVWINPLQAFIDGDVTDSQDLGAFLREGLNGINADCKFGYVIVHHTTKPATGKDRQERQWHEVMYDMAGGAEIINWARGIISIRALEEPGKFKVVLAKRGRRAGVTREVPQGTGTRLEPVTVIGLQHASGFLPGPNGERTDTGIIYWHPYALPDERDAKEPSKPTGRVAKHHFSDVFSVFPKKSSNGLPLNELHRLIEANMPISRPSLHNILKRWADEGDVEIIKPEGQPMRYRAML